MHIPCSPGCRDTNHCLSAMFALLPNGSDGHPYRFSIFMYMRFPQWLKMKRVESCARLHPSTAGVDRGTIQ